MRAILTLVVALLPTTTVACGGADSAAPGEPTRPEMVVTNSILGDVVREVVGDEASVEVIMPLGADPHELSPSAGQAEAMEGADLLVVNGAGFEQGLLDVIAAAADAGTPTFTFTDHVDLVQTDGADDPHFWTDPTRMAAAVQALSIDIAELDGVDRQAIADRAERYIGRLVDLDVDLVEALEPLSGDQRTLVTNHEAFTYFAERYGFEVVGAVIPSSATGAEPSAADLEDLAETVEAEGVPAIFAETTSPERLAKAVAEASGDDVEVVALFTESLGEAGSGAETYIDMLRTDADRIVAALR